MHQERTGRIVSIVRLSVLSHLYMCLFDAVCYGVLILFVHVHVLLYIISRILVDMFSGVGRGGFMVLEHPLSTSDCTRSRRSVPEGSC